MVNSQGRKPWEARRVRFFRNSSPEGATEVAG
jgi:hypothetical protein